MATKTKQKTKTAKPAKSLDENLKYLRQILSVDPLLYDINQEEALEFLDAVEHDIAVEREELSDALKGAEDEVKELNERVEELKKERDELEENSTDDFNIHLWIDNMLHRDKLEEFLTTEIYPALLDQNKFILM